MQCFINKTPTGSVRFSGRQLDANSAANNLSAEGGTLWSPALVDALQSDRRTGDLKKSTFRDFLRVIGYFSPQSRRQKTNSRSTKMNNPVYWAMLVGMSILLMEQGKWWLCHSALTCSAGVCRLCLDQTACHFMFWAKCELCMWACVYIWHQEACHVSRSLKKRLVK